MDDDTFFILEDGCDEQPNLAAATPAATVFSSAKLSVLTRISERVQHLATPCNEFGRKILSAVCRATCQESSAPSAIATELASAGFEVLIRRACSEPTSGSSIFRSLRHEFLVVRGAGEFHGMEFIVEPSLRQHFVIPHPSPDYQHLLSRTPDVFVGGSCRLVPVVQLLCALMADSYTRQGLPLPPWRQESSILSKWLPRPHLTSDLLLFRGTAEDGAAPPAASPGRTAASPGRTAAAEPSLGADAGDLPPHLHHKHLQLQLCAPVASGAGITITRTNSSSSSSSSSSTGSGCSDAGSSPSRVAGGSSSSRSSSGSSSGASATTASAGTSAPSAEHCFGSSNNSEHWTEGACSSGSYCLIWSRAAATQGTPSRGGITTWGFEPGGTLDTAPGWCCPQQRGDTGAHAPADGACAAATAGGMTSATRQRRMPGAPPSRVCGRHGSAKSELTAQLRAAGAPLLSAG